MVRIDEVIVYFDTMFHSNGKGTLPFETMESILETQALFPRLDFGNVVYLWKQCEMLGIKADVIARYETFRRLGGKIELGNKGIRLREYFPKIQKYVENTFFDISQTDLPYHFSRRQRIKEFTLNDFFLKKIYEDYTNSTGFTLEQSPNKSISFDYTNKIIRFPIMKEPRHTFYLFAKAAAIVELAPTIEDKYASLTSKEKVERLELQSRLLANATMATVGVTPQRIEPDKKKEYIWGATLDERIANAEDIASALQNILKNMELEKNFNIAFKAQENKKRKEYVTAPKNGANTQNIHNQEALYAALKEENQRLKKEILIKGDIYQIVAEHSTNIKKSSTNEFKANCILPNHDEKTPSFTFNVSKNVYKCWGCNEGGDIVKLEMATNNLSFPDAIKSLASKFNIPTRHDEIVAEFKGKNSKLAAKQSFLAKFPNEDRAKVMAMSDRAFREYSYDKAKSLDTSKTYVVKQKPAPQEPRPEKEKKDSCVIKTTEVNSSAQCVTYLAKERKIVLYPKELKYIEGLKKGINEDGKPYTQTYKGIGYINESGGADIRLPRNFSKEEGHKKTRSVGDKDIVVLNKENLNSPKRVFIVSESGWDYAAAYNQAPMRAVMDRSIGIIANGTSSVEKAIDFIKKHGGEDPKILILSQADESNLRFAKKLLLSTGIMDYARIEFTNQELEEKQDVNDLHVNNIDISTRLYGTLDVFSYLGVEKASPEEESKTLSPAQELV